MALWCETCKRSTFTLSGAPHVCPPVWLVWNPDESDEIDSGRFYAYSPEDAVEQWAKHDDQYSAEYRIVGGSAATVLVRKEGAIHDTPRRFKVTGEAVPSYTATEVKTEHD